MKREDAAKLLGGYATGTLTAEERRLLFEAALEDQELFDALAREQELKEALELPGARERLLAQISGGESVWHRVRAWAARPVAWAAAGACAMAVVALLTIPMLRRSSAPETKLSATGKAPASARQAAPPVQREGDRNHQESRRLLKLPARQAPPAPDRVTLPEPPALAPESAAGNAAPTALRRQSPPPPPPKEHVEVTAAAPAPPPVRMPFRAEEAAAAEAADKSKEPESSRAAKSAAPHQRAAGPAAPSGLEAATRAAPGGVLGGIIGGVPASAPPPPPAKADVAPVALSYRVLKENNGVWAEVTNAELSRGDAVRLSLEPRSSGFIYVLQGSDTSGYKVISRFTALQPGLAQLAPAEGAYMLAPAPQRLLVVMSREPIAQFTGATSVKHAPSSGPGVLVFEVRPSK